MVNKFSLFITLKKLNDINVIFTETHNHDSDEARINQAKRAGMLMYKSLNDIGA